MSAVFTHGPAGTIRMAPLDGGRFVLRLAAVLVLGVALASPAQAQFGDLSPEAQDNFGGALARGDFNNDGFQDLAVGVPVRGHQNGGSGALAADRLGRSGRGDLRGRQRSSERGRQFWRQGSNGIGDVPESGDNFGRSLAVGDFNGDHFADLAIGVPSEDLGGVNGRLTDTGAVHVLYGSAQGLSTSAVMPQFWHQASPGVKDVADASDFFGWALAAGDFNLDGYADLAVGVPFETVQTVRAAGAVNVLFGTASGLTADLIDDQLWTRMIRPSTTTS